jgi:hypothetical protein
MKDYKMWLGNTYPRDFIVKGGFKKFGNIAWYTNLKERDVPPLPLTKSYDENVYFKFDNYDCLNVDKCVDIPYDYFDKIAVPISFFLKHNKEQFEILGMVPDKELMIKGERRYKRIIIKRTKK